MTVPWPWPKTANLELELCSLGKQRTLNET